MEKYVFWPIKGGMPWFFFTFFLMNFDPAHHTYNIQLTENIFEWHLFISKFSSAAPINKFVALGISPGNLGLHLAEKGWCSYANVGSTVCPPMVSICLQAMWSVGSIKECYLQYEKAGDQYLGWVASGLDVDNVSFAISPPYFESGLDDDVKENVLGLLREFVLGGEQYHRWSMSPAVFLFCPTLLLFWFLGKGLPSQNKMQVSPFFINIPNCAKDAAAVIFLWNNSVLTPSFTGLPPHVSILAQLEGLKAALELSKNEIIKWSCSETVGIPVLFWQGGDNCQNGRAPLQPDEKGWSSWSQVIYCNPGWPWGWCWIWFWWTVTVTVTVFITTMY